MEKVPSCVFWHIKLLWIATLSDHSCKRTHRSFVLCWYFINRLFACRTIHALALSIRTVIWQNSLGRLVEKSHTKSTFYQIQIFTRKTSQLWLWTTTPAAVGQQLGFLSWCHRQNSGYGSERRSNSYFFLEAVGEVYAIHWLPCCWWAKSRSRGRPTAWTASPSPQAWRLQPSACSPHWKPPRHLANVVLLVAGNMWQLPELADTVVCQRGVQLTARIKDVVSVTRGRQRAHV